ncbi:hypothetical protein LJR231_003509 [Phyllobacterium sp. LjRoot231]
MTSTIALIERLKKIEDWFVSDYGYNHAATIKEAATERTPLSY